jgi:hypothetical protein
MPFDLSSLTAMRRDVTVHYHEYAITVAYNPARITYAYTQQLQRDLTASAEHSEADSPIITALISLLVDWDVTDGGAKAPLTFDTLRSLPLALLLSIWDGVKDDRDPERAEGEAAGAGQ